jgi:hypothetical protein
MVLQANEFKIENDGIWISKKVLEECKQHYKQVAENCFDEKNELKTLFYIGKSDVYNDLLKHFEPLEP